jgi:hypothetical protein
MTPAVSLRHLPHPFAGALAICSDLDETPDLGVYLDIARYLSGHATSQMGPGLGLEVGNSIYFDMPPGQFAYWNAGEKGQAAVRALIRSGHIDCIHSFGDLAVSRAHAERALAELREHGCRIEVWVDHSRAASNLGPDIMQGEGDVPGSPAYHVDLTRAFGMRYVWRGRVTSLIGQDRPASFGGLLTARHPLASAVTLGKELAKHVLARAGSAKYAPHAFNRAYRVVSLRDGTRVLEFLRCNPSWGGVSHADNAAGIAEVLTEAFLRRLVEREGVCILYTHLGKVRSRQEPIPPASRAALARLATFVGDGSLLVTTTRRLLRYLTVRDHLRFRTEAGDDRRMVTLEAVDDPLDGAREPTAEELQGITFSTSAAEITVRLSSGEALPCEVTRSGGVTHARIPWRPLRFPAEEIG